jgi:catechol 2,3-dioxygenase-like lactoylglutathione lyase family enzyme
MGMFLYATVGSSNIERSVKFYDAVFETIGVGRGQEWTDTFVGWGPSYDDGESFWVCTPFDGRAPTPGNGTMFSFRAESEAEVQAFHAAALANGGTDEGAPGTRPYYEPTFYVAYVRDPDGNKLACVYHKHVPGT